MAKDRFRKYIWILQKLYQSGGMSYKELMEHWRNSLINYDGGDIPRRTFDEYRKGIETTFDIDIVCNPKSFKYCIMDKEELKKDTVTSWLINSFSVNNIIQDSRNLKKRIAFEQIPSGNDRLMTIVEAMQQNKSLRITYQAFYSRIPSVYVTEPYCIRVYRQRWYLLGADPQSHKLYTYALDRMSDVTMTDDSFEMPDSFDMHAFYKDWFGIIVMPEEYDLETIRLKASTRHYKRDYLLKLPLHASQKEIEHTSEYSVFEYRTYPTEDFFQEILSHGPDVEILSPRWVRDEMKSRVEEMQKLYAAPAD